MGGLEGGVAANLMEPPSAMCAPPRIAGGLTSEGRATRNAKTLRYPSWFKAKSPVTDTLKPLQAAGVRATDAFMHAMRLNGSGAIVRLRRSHPRVPPHVAEHGPGPGIGEDRVERGREVGATVADHELDAPWLVAEVHEEVAGLPGGRVPRLDAA